MATRCPPWPDPNLALHKLPFGHCQLLLFMCQPPHAVFFLFLAVLFPVFFLLLSLCLLLQLLWETIPIHLSQCSLVNRVLWLNVQTLKSDCWSLASELFNLSMP